MRRQHEVWVLLKLGMEWDALERKSRVLERFSRGVTFAANVLEWQRKMFCSLCSCRIVKSANILAMNYSRKVSLVII